MAEEDGVYRSWKVNTSPGGGFVAWRPGYALPRHWRTTLDGPHLPYLVELEFVADEAGPDCRSVRFLQRDDGEPIGARRMRDIPLAECMRMAIASATWHEGREPGEVTYKLEERDMTERLRMARSPDQRTSDEHLREVADVYRQASEKPTRAVQSAWQPVSYSTAARWVMEARRRGFLPPTTQGRGGMSARQED